MAFLDRLLSDRQVNQIHRDLLVPPSPEEIADMLPASRAGSDGELLFRFGALVALADGAASSRERAWLDRLAKALAIEPRRKKELEEEIFA